MTWGERPATGEWHGDPRRLSEQVHDAEPQSRRTDPPRAQRAGRDRSGQHGRRVPRPWGAGRLGAFAVPLEGVGAAEPSAGEAAGREEVPGPSGGASRALTSSGLWATVRWGPPKVFSGRAVRSGLPLGKGEKVALAAEMGDGPSRTAARGARSVLGAFVAILPIARSRNEGSRHVGCLFEPLIPSSTTRMSRGNLTP